MELLLSLTFPSIPLPQSSTWCVCRCNPPDIICSVQSEFPPTFFACRFLPFLSSSNLGVNTNPRETWGPGKKTCIYITQKPFTSFMYFFNRWTATALKKNLSVLSCLVVQDRKDGREREEWTELLPLDGKRKNFRGSSTFFFGGSFSPFALYPFRVRGAINERERERDEKIASFRLHPA